MVRSVPDSRLPRRLESFAQLRDVTVQGRQRRFRRRLAPQTLDQTVTGDDLVRPQNEHGQDGSLLRSAERHGPPVDPSLERA